MLTVLWKTPKLGFLILLLCSTLGCSNVPVTRNDFSAPTQWGAAERVVKVKRLYLSDQPDAAALVEAKANGVGVVINLRDSDEMDWNEKDAANQVGLKYYQVPIAGKAKSFDTTAMRSISELVAAHQGEKILIHCASGNRASAWLATHLVDDHGMSVAKSIKLATRIATNKEAVTARLEKYYSSN